MYQVSLSGSQSSALVSIGTNISSENASIANASITSLSVVDLKSATFSPNTISVSTLNVSSLNLDPSYVFPVLNVSTLNSIEESFVNVSVQNISANQITADNIQPLLTAGDNISILNNRISALNNNLPATGNFTTLNTSTINASNLSTGDLTFDSNFTLSNKFLKINSTTNITENSGDLITSGAVYNALNKFSTNISDGRSLTNTKLIEGGDVIKPIIPGTTSTIKTEVPAGTSQNIMKVFYTTKFGADAILSAVANFGYKVSGNGTDQITARLEYNNGSTTNNIGQQEQSWTDANGGGTRSGVMSPRQGVRRSGVSAGTQVYFQIIIQNDSDDTWTFLTPDACNFHITESLDNAGSDLNLNTGNLQADEANFNSLTIQAGSGSGQATIGRTYLGNNAFGNMACLSVNGNDGANNYGFAQVANNQTIMNAMPSAYNSFRCENVEVASIGQIGLGIGLGVNNTAVFPLEVSGDSLVSGIMFANEIDTANADITNISNTNFSGTNANFQEVNVSGNLIVNGTTFTTTNLTAGENVNISNNVISAFFGSGGQVNLNSIQVDGGVDIGGVLNVSQTSNFSNSVNVGDILYVGEAGNHEGSVVVYSNIVGDNYTIKINSSTLEVNCSATGNLSVINFFVGNNKSLEITNSGIQATSITSDNIQVADITADVLTFIDGRATFRFNTPQINASNASIDTADIGQINASVVTCDVLDTDELDLDVLNVSTLNFSQGIGDRLDVNVCINTSDLNVSQVANLKRIVIGDNDNENGLECLNAVAVFRDINVSNLFAQGSDMYVGSSNQSPNNIGGQPRCRVNFWSTSPTNLFEMGTRMGVNENNEAFLSLEPFGGVSNYTININNFSTMNMTQTETTFNHKLNASNISGDEITADTIDSNVLITDTLNLNDPSTGLDTTIERTGGNTVLTSVAGSIIFNTNTNTTNRAMIIGHDNIIQTRTIQNAGLMETRNFSVDENVSVTGSLTANDAEIMNNVDIYNDLFVANRIDATTIDGIDVVGDNGDFGLLDATTINATTANSSTTNSSNGNFSSLAVNATGTFQAVVANIVNVAGTLNATNIPGYQKELTAGENVSILNDVISVIIEEFPSDANFSTVTSQIGNFSTINADTSIINTMNTSNINTSFFSCIDEAGFSGTLNGNIISCNELDSDDIVTTEITATRMIGTNARATSMQTSSLNISDPSSGLATNIVRSGNNTTLTSIAGSVIINTNPQSTTRAMIIGADNLIQTRTIQNAGLMETRNFSVDENVSVTGSLSVNQLSIDGKNASTASIAFSNDFLFDTFSNTLRLAEDANQAVADILAEGIETPSVNTSNLNVDGFTTLDAVAVSQSINALVANLNTINSSGTANISVINSSVINGDNLSTASISFNSADFVFSNNELSLLGGAGGGLPADANFSSVNTDVLNASTINASNIVGYQETISGGTNINVINNEVSTDTNVNFNSVTSSTADITTLTNSKITSTDRIIINNSSPTLYLKDTNGRSGMIHMNSNRMYFLSGVTNSETWTQVGGRWPLILYTDSNTAEFGGAIRIKGRSYLGSQLTVNENAFDIDAKSINKADALGLRSKADNYNIVNFYNNTGGNRGAIIGVNAGSIRYTTTSDRRKKEDIVDLENGLEKVMKLKPRTYRWKEGHELDDGFIAQEVFETFPHFIPTNRFKCDISQNDVYHGKLCSCCNIEKKANGEDYIFGIDYGKFTPYLCKAIQEQQQQIETLKKQYDELLSILTTE